MRFSGSTGTGRSIVFGDDPASNEHSPVELVATALAACTAMDVISILEKKREAVASYTVSVVAAQRDDYPQVLTTIELLHEVVAMLSAGETAVHHRYRVESTGDEPIVKEGEVIVTGPFKRPEIVA
jgi:uncharacterized OsmC-like protein